MAEIRVKVGSVTNAQRAKRALLSHGMQATVKRAIHIKKGDGCGYSVVFYGDVDAGLGYIKNAGIKIISVSTNGVS